MRLAITGSSGLVGTVLETYCRRRGYDVVPFDIVRADARECEDIRDLELLKSRLASCDGVVHLAAISRVAWGEQRPDLCEGVNIEGTRVVIEAMSSGRRDPPWLLFASSREIYGDPPQPVITEDAPVAPVNVYGRSKAEGEKLVAEARRPGIRTAIIRLSNVYGGRRDHPDRAIPALIANALSGSDLRITGAGNYFDFVHVEDSVAGLMAVIEQLAAGESGLPPIHLATGVATTLEELAQLAVEVTDSNSRIIKAPARAFDVTGFCGSPARAARLLGWRPEIDVRRGVAAVAESLRQEGPLPIAEIPDPDVLCARRLRK